MLRYPYSKQDLITCFKYFKLNIDENKIEIKRRETAMNFVSKYEKEISVYRIM